MTLEKYTIEITTLKTYFEYFCKHNHQKSFPFNIKHTYQNQDFYEDINLCNNCFDTFQYSLQRVQNCQYDEKPRCRKCPTPCYEEVYWKKVAKVMRYSGIRLTLHQIFKMAQ